ncbi:MAG: hypothetical protein KA142_12720, partial [Chromatiaceae bacterium]|nr:hypothetical protein [Chromatiaceae bacterium]MBP9604884.1 hypothetical protein [Chromatiaceae bacterium]
MPEPILDKLRGQSIRVRFSLKWTPKTGQQFKLASNQQGHVRMGEAKRKTYPASFKAKVGLE